MDHRVEPQLKMMKISDYVYTGILLTTHMTVAIGVSTMGPAFVDLTYLLSTNIQRVSLAPTVVSFGNILGTLFSILYKYYNRQLIIIWLVLLMAISSAAIPFTTNIWQFYGCALVSGICMGAWVAAYNVWLIEIWQHRAAHVLFLSQLMYGLGAVLGPLIDSPYLTGDVTPDNNSTGIANQTNDHVITIDERRHKLHVPFITAGALQATFPILLLLMYIIRRYRKNEITHEAIRSETINNNRYHMKTLTIILLAVCLSTINSLEMVYFNFGSTYFQYIPVRMCANTAAQLVSVMSGAYTIGQVINFVVAFVFKTEHVISVHFFASLAMFLCLDYFEKSPEVLWLVSAGIGLSVSVLFPAVLGFFGKHLDITDRIATLVWIACGVANSVPPLFLGYYIKKDPQALVIIEVTFLLISFTAFSLFLILRTKLR